MDMEEILLAKLFAEQVVSEGLVDADTLKFEEVQTLPSASSAKPNVIYLKKNDFSGHYDMYVLLNGKIQQLDDTSVDLSGYAQKSELPTKVSELENDAGYLTEHQDLSDYAKKTELPVVPVQSINGKTGEVKLTAGDVGAISQDDLQEATSEALAQAKASGEFDGPQGQAGEDGRDGADGRDGEKGVGISHITDNEDGSMTIHLDDGNYYDVDIPEGQEGVGIDRIENSEYGSITIYLTNGNNYQVTLTTKAEAVADAAGEAPTAEEFNALLTSLRNAGILST